MGPNISGGTEYFIFSAEIFSPGGPNILSRGTKLGGTKFFIKIPACGSKFVSGSSRKATLAESVFVG